MVLKSLVRVLLTSINSSEKMLHVRKWPPLDIFFFFFLEREHDDRDDWCLGIVLIQKVLYYLSLSKSMKMQKNARGKRK